MGVLSLAGPQKNRKMTSVDHRVLEVSNFHWKNAYEVTTLDEAVNAALLVGIGMESTTPQ